jgi:hypothetical protein
MRHALRIIGGAAALLLASPADAQLPPAIGQTVDGLTGPLLREADVGRLGETVGRPVRDLTRLRLRTLLRENPRALEADARGLPVVRGEVMAIAPRAAALEAARAAGFTVARRRTLEGAGIEVVTLRPPPRQSARRALRALREMDPDGRYDLNHIYAGAGDARRAGSGAAAAAATGGAAGAGLIDGGVAAHPAVDGLIAEQRGFAPGGVVPGRHGTAVASLLAGRDGGFRGATPGTRLLVADIYGDGPTGGSADALAAALGWMAARGVPVVNVSVVGPPNLLVEAVVGALSAQGRLIVAAVGNDGPAAGPLYPAAYPGVIGVTAVDRRDRALPEACRGAHVAFAAPGADMAAADAGGGYARVRGTSYAAPLVAGLLAGQGGIGAVAVETLAREARDLGRAGVDPVYGRGLVCGACRNALP